MKHLLLTTVAAVLLVGCGPQPPDISIHDAAGEGNIEAVNQHIAAGTDLNAKSDGDGWTPLHFAAFGGHKEIAELLIGSGAEVNAKGLGGYTPLLHAAYSGHKEVAELLIAKGADVNAKDDDDQTPLDLAEPFEDDSPEDKANKKETADLLGKHGGKTKKELEAADN